MKKLLLLTLVAFFILAPSAWSANTVLTQGAFTQITPDGATDYITGIESRYTSITFVPSAVSDKLTVHAYSLTGPIVYQVVVPTTAPVQRIFLTDQFWVPYIKATECTFGVAANVRIIFERE